jgi:hypothetical protein
VKRLWGWLVVVVWLGVVASARADLAAFDSLSGDFLPIPAGYEGFTWSDNFYYLNALGRTNSGYYAGMVSSPNVASNRLGYDVDVMAATPFVFNGAYFTGVWNDGLSIDIGGWLGGSEVYSTTVVVDSTASTWVGLDWTNVDKLTFHSYGGTHNDDYSGAGVHFAMDNFTFNEPVAAVPVPGAALLGAIGLSLAGWRLRRRTA